MARISAVLASVLSISALGSIGVSVAHAQDATDQQMAQFRFSGVVNADNVYVRSGSSENDYPVLKLAKGDTVIVVGDKFDWLKVLPPEGSFCLVGKAWVDKRGDGTIGRVRDDATNVNVRVASSLNNMITKVAMQLKGGEDVKILGEQDEYFKIVPPAGTFMYIHKKFVDPVKQVDLVNNNGKMEVKPLDTAPIKPAETVAVPTPPVEAKVDEPKKVEQATAPTTAPAAVATAAETEFDALETKFEESSKLPLEQQPVDELLAGYNKIVSEKKVPSSMLKIADFRIKGLNVRKDALTQFKETQRKQEEIAAAIKPVEAEGQEIDQRIKDAQVTQFTAVGTLRQSTLPYGGRLLYRLTDPASGRTVVYLNTDDANVIKFEGLFVGVRGELTEDTARKIKFIQPKETQQIDPTSLLKGTVTSNLVPASLMPTASNTEK